MTHQALLLVDLQNDFCPGGALAVAEGHQVVAVANRLLAWSAQRGIPALATQDWHPANHGSFANIAGEPVYTTGLLAGLEQTFWPVHCVQNTPGSALHPQLAAHLITACFTKGENPQVDSYSAFFDNGHRQQTGLESYLHQHQITSLIVMGLATDYCVKFSVLDALTLGFEVAVITDGCRGVELAQGDSLSAFSEMAAEGATLYTLNDWLETHP